MATYTNTVWVQGQVAPFGPTTLTALDNLTLNLATIILTTSTKLDLGTLGTMTTIKGSLTVDEDLYLTGNLVLSGATKVADLSPENVLISDNHLYLNNGYNTAVAQTGGLVVNTLPTATNDTVDAGGFTAGVVGVSNPTVATTGAATFAANDLIQISGATDPANNGLFEVLSHAANVLTICGVGTTATTEDFTQNQFTTDATAAGAIRKVNVAVLRAGTDGVWETAYGNTSGLVFTDVGAGGGGDPAQASTTNQTWTVNSDNAGANEDAALYLNSGDGSLMRQGQITMNYSNSVLNGWNFGFNNTPAVTDYGFGFYFTPTNGGAASGATAGGEGGRFFFQGGAGGAAGAGAGLPGGGGPVTLRAGTGGMGGAGATDGALGGSLTFEGGTGGMAAGGTAGSGGNATIKGGDGGSGTGFGASLLLYGGGGGNLGAATLTAKNIDLGATAVARTVNLGTGAAAQTVNVGSTNGASATAINSGTGNLLLDANGNLIIFNGVLVGFTANAEENITAGDLLYLTTTGTVGKADANAAGKKNVVGVAGNTDTTGNPIRVASLPGQVVPVNTDLSSFTPGDVVFLSKTAGEMVVDVSGYTTSGDAIFRVGQVHTAAVAGTAKILYLPQYIMTYA